MAELIDVDDVPRTLSQGRFRTRRALGRGGVSDVFLVQDQLDGVLRVVKVLRPELRQDPYLRGRFLAEALALQQIVHPHVIRLLETFAEPDLGQCLLLEYCPGGSARVLARREDGLSAPHTAKIAAQALLGLEEVHRRGVVHRDVKPSNLLIDFYGRVKLADFGIAQFRDSGVKTDPGLSIGTPAYMAPELRNDEGPATVGSDVYAMGASLFTLSTNRTSPDLSLAAQLPDHKLWDLVPESLRGIIRGATQVEPGERFPSAAAMRQALLPLTEG